MFEALFDDEWVEPHAGSAPGPKSDGAELLGMLIDPLAPNAEVLRHRHHAMTGEPREH